MRQLEISQNNYNNALTQVKFVQDDILEKRKKESVDDTLKQCNYYLHDIQVVYKDLIETGIVSGMPLDWKHLKIFTSSSFKEKYPTLFAKINDMDRPTKNKMLITLYQLEAFSSFILHGSGDRLMAKNIIGDTYVKQIGFLLGPISYFREDIDAVFARNTIKLYFEWKDSASENY